jgi:hypothetical protein
MDSVDRLVRTVLKNTRTIDDGIDIGEARNPRFATGIPVELARDRALVREHANGACFVPHATDDIVPAGDQAAGNVPPDKPCRAGQENTHSLPCDLIKSPPAAPGVGR